MLKFSYNLQCLFVFASLFMMLNGFRRECFVEKRILYVPKYVAIFAYGLASFAFIYLLAVRNHVIRTQCSLQKWNEIFVSQLMCQAINEICRLPTFYNVYFKRYSSFLKSTERFHHSNLGRSLRIRPLYTKDEFYEIHVQIEFVSICEIFCMMFQTSLSTINFFFIFLVNLTCALWVLYLKLRIRLNNFQFLNYVLYRYKLNDLHIRFLSVTYVPYANTLLF